MADSPYQIEVFRTGTHTSSDGRKITIDESAVDQAISTYDPENFRVPLIVSHDTGNYSDRDIVRSELAFGVADSFKRIGNKVFAVFNRIAPQFKQWVEQGRLHSISSSFYLPESPSNPYPGQWAFRHVAALGVNPPAVKGMAPIRLSAFNLSAPDEDVANFMMPFAYSGFRGVAYVLRNLRDWLIEEKGLEIAERLAPSELLSSLETDSPAASEEALNGVIQEIDTLRQSLMGVRSAVSDVSAVVQEVAESVVESPYEEDYYYSYGEGQMYKKSMKKMMSDKGMDMAAFAKKAGMKMDRLGEIMDGKSKMDDEEKKAMAGAMEMEEDDFMKAMKPDAQFEAEQELETLRSQLIAIQLKDRKLEQANFVQQHEAAKRLTPALTNPIEIEFSEGGETKKQEIQLVDFMAGLSDKQLSFMRSFIAKLPSQLETEVQTASKASVDASSFEEDDTPKDFSVTDIAEQAKALVREERSKGNASFTEVDAVNRILAKGVGV